MKENFKRLIFQSFSIFLSDPPYTKKKNSGRIKKFIKESVFLNNYFRMTFAKRALRYAFLIYTKKSRAIASLDSIIFISDWFYTSKSSCSFSAVIASIFLMLSSVNF